MTRLTMRPDPLTSIAGTNPDPSRREVSDAWGRLTPEEKDAVMVATSAARRTGVTVEELATFEAAAREWWTRKEAEHVSGCDDPGCDWYVCRLARGWTVAEVEADLDVCRKAHYERQR
jgi:hypothetical protein